jgi:hypothetical protein
MESLIDSRPACDALGLKTAKGLRAVCERFGVPLTKLSSRQLALTRSNFDLLLQRATHGNSEAA